MIINLCCVIIPVKGLVNVKVVLYLLIIAIFIYIALQIKMLILLLIIFAVVLLLIPERKKTFKETKEDANYTPILKDEEQN